MSKKVLGLFVVVSLFVCGSVMAGAPGVQEVPVQTYVGSTPAPVYQPAPVFQPAQVAGVRGTACAMAPYEVKVEYTPIEPQPGVCTYCTCLPYGCPDGSPITPCSGVGNCGWSCGTLGVTNGCFGQIASIGNTCGNFGTGLAGNLLTRAGCFGEAFVCGTLGTIGNCLNCLFGSGGSGSCGCVVQ